MMYSIFFSNVALRQFNKLPNDIQDRIIGSLERMKIRPHAYVKKLVGNPYFRLRVGDYRIIVNIQGNDLRILVVEVGHRRNVYK